MAEDVLKKFTALLKEVDVGYKMYWAKKDAKAPVKQRVKLERMATNLRYLQLKDKILNFRRNNLLLRFNVLAEKWERQATEKEMGLRLGTRAQYKDIAAKKTPDRPVKKPQAPAPSAAAGKGKPATGLRVLYKQFKAVNSRLGKTVVDYDTFKALIEKKIAVIKQKTQADTVRFVLKVEKGKPALKAKVIKHKKE